MASPAECVRAVLLKAQMVIFPFDGMAVLPDSSLVPCYVNEFPDQPDRIMALYDKQGTTFGRLQTGKYTSHPGVKVMVRDLTSAKSFDLIDALSTFLAGRTGRQSVPVRGVENFLGSIYQTGDPVSLGEETGTNRTVWVMNLQVAMEDLAKVPLE